ncbi:MAG TPA: helix-turn-helix domain-containing protein [Nitrososphaeraceae archaeon]|jgi:DNA-binding HxlR family transcriptional regulator|nr:helix-turn-helix domain-containing protein [Nitrososphaeraceae archaeon]
METVIFLGMVMAQKFSYANPMCKYYLHFSIQRQLYMMEIFVLIMKANLSFTDNDNRGSNTTRIMNSSSNTEMKCCPINNTFKIIGKKFTILILRNMINGNQNRFNQLLNSIEESNPKTLSARLKEMEKMGLIKRKVYYNQSPVRIEYYPTEKGLALQPILDMMAAYSMKYCSKDVFKDSKPREFKQVYGREIETEIPR